MRSTFQLRCHSLIAFSPGDGAFHCGVKFVPDELMDAVLLGETLYEVVFVLPDSLDEVGGDAGVEGAVAFAGEDVDAGGFHGWEYGVCW